MAYLAIKLGLFCLLLLSVLYLIKRQNIKISHLQKEGELKILETHHITQATKLCVIKYKDKQLLLGITNQNINVLNMED